MPNPRSQWSMGDDIQQREHFKGVAYSNYATGLWSLEKVIEEAKKIASLDLAPGGEAAFAAEVLAFIQRIPLKSAEERARDAITFNLDRRGVPVLTAENIRRGVVKMGVELRYNSFNGSTHVKGLPDYGNRLDDATFGHIWLQLDERFNLGVPDKLLHAVLAEIARQNKFHPVKDYLDSLKPWDGIERLDKWLTTYGGAEDNRYVRAVGALTLVAAVRRIKQPGCKFDEMLLLISRQQGVSKSEAVATLAVEDEWYLDGFPLNLDDKRILERTSGKWIIEAAELVGAKQVEQVKSLLSRRSESARLAYGHYTTEVSRQFIIIGTTNDTKPLRDPTGDRRYWPIRIKRFDIAALRADRDQLWAEAVVRERNGVSIRLPEHLWADAAAEQSKHSTVDDWEIKLADALDGKEGKIFHDDIWRILEVDTNRRAASSTKRLEEIMTRLGWDHPGSKGTVSIDGCKKYGWVKGTLPYKPHRVLGVLHGSIMWKDFSNTTSDTTSGIPTASDL